jgi:hypothetical protein
VIATGQLLSAFSATMNPATDTMYVVIDNDPAGPVELTLPMPPDFRSSFSGSAFPFPSEFVAFNPHQRSVMVEAELGRVVKVPETCRRPSWYYHDGIYGPPRAIVRYRTTSGASASELQQIENCPAVPWRALTRSKPSAPPLRGPVVTQEAMLYAKRWCRVSPAT